MRYVALLPVHENVASTAEGILEDIMTGRVQGAPLDDEQEVEEEEVDQQPSNRPPSHGEALQHVHSLMQFVQTNLPHLFFIFYYFFVHNCHHLYVVLFLYASINN